jgi:6,7-dimethyl-8-ribityllumazine synthase
MSSDSPSAEAVDAAGLRVAVVAARFNGELVDALLSRVLGRLSAAGVRASNLSVTRVPGSHELPVAARLLIGGGNVDVVIALGVIVRGATIHYELVATAASQGLTDVSIATQVPVINGVIVAESEDQARERCAGPIDRGAEFADAAVSMASLRRRLSK